MDRREAATVLSIVLLIASLAGCGGNYQMTSGRQYAKEGKWPEAAEAFEVALQQDPNNAEGHLSYAKALAELGRYPEAADHFSKARELFTVPAKIKGLDELQHHYFSVPFNRGVALSNDKKFQEAAQEYEKAAQVKPQDPEGHRMLGYAYSQIQGTKEERDAGLARSVTAFRKAVEIEPKHCATWMDLGASLRSAGRWQEAIEAYKSGISENPDDKCVTESWAIIGDVYYNAKDYAAARDAYVNATKIRPDDPQLYFQIGLCDHNMEKYLDAASAFQKAADYALAAGRQDVYEDALYNAGLAAFKGEDHQRAIEIAGLLIEAKGDESSYYMLRGRSRSRLAKQLEEKGKRSEAKKMSDLSVDDFKKAESLASSK